VRILCDLNTPAHLRLFDSTLEQLGARGHEVLLTFTLPDLYPGALERLRELDHPPTRLGHGPRRGDELASMARDLRGAMDYVRYLDPRFARAHFLRNRARARVLRYGPFSRPFASIRRLRPWQVKLLLRGLTAAERAIPSAPEIEEFIRSIGPDLVVVSPLVTAGSPQTDYVKSARALGIPTAVCVASWDNLTNKGHMRLVPDLVVVWNDAQRREAVELHGVPAERVAVTGAQPFDRWFGRAPSALREEFCAKVGLRPDRPFVLFCASRSNIGEGVEQRFVQRWVAAIRGGTGPLDPGTGLLVRPHPEGPGLWDEVIERYPDAVVWPTSVHNPIGQDTRADFFDSLYHSAAVVGTNTSAMIEAAIVGRPVLTVRAPEFEQSQQGTLHFQYLRPEHGGFLREAWTLEQHLTQLDDAIRHPEDVQAANMRFVEDFIRPAGIDRACTPIVVDVLERLAATAPRPSGAPGVARAGERALRVVAQGLAKREERRRPGAAKLRARRTSRVLKRVASYAGRYDRRVSAAIRSVAETVRTRGDRRVRSLRHKHLETAAAHREVVEEGRQLLDPERRP